ncbi:endonuclease YncB(thermonuclease family) [Plasticicumulans lactativorans]|uniref:Endonuclease YncB(Thermonuclease family) n=1 Tax=Plasticicumulans lactativorans TaxID=1133106 RepID=A0A4R2LRP6_9GAMM|nr:thermonuclease family protein [Plasticicumulans lactativorans]TCO82325.1 endonuclease YncB(thermonuclease family) [Plasticicumulans lactativorans]
MRPWLERLQRRVYPAIGGERRRLRGWPAPFALAGVAVLGYALLAGAPPQAEALAAGRSLDCRVLEVHDGDTVTLRCERSVRRVRVWGIDAPELAQVPWGELARTALAVMLPPQTPVRLEVLDTDSYRRTVGRLWTGTRDLGLELVRAGRAAVYTRYNRDPVYQAAQAAARASRLGVWATPGAQQAPWTWRHLNPR